VSREDIAEVPFIIEAVSEGAVATAGQITAVAVAGSMEIAKDVIDGKSM
jgi:hypothetical protein